MSIGSAPNINLAWSMLIAEECARLGVAHAVVCPGSRSAPLTVAFARHPKLTLHVAHDERGAAFLALGIAKQSRMPAVLIVTSGTAVANTLPAFVEARMSRTPLLLFAADRPPELLDCGANQSIAQAQLLSSAARWSVAMPSPSTEIAAEYVLSTVDEAFARARGHAGAQPGGVHLNCAFREPLAPESKAWDAEWLRSIDRWSNDATRAPWRRATKAVPTDVKIDAGILVVGRTSRAAARSLASWRGTMVADITSGLAVEGTAGADLVLRAAMAKDAPRALVDALAVDAIVCVGDGVVSKRLNAWIAAQDCAIDVYGVGDPRMDSSHRATSVYAASSVFTATTTLAPHEGWSRALRCATAAASNALRAEHSMCEPTAIAEVSAACAQSESGTMFYGSSMPIRDADFFAILPPSAWSVGSNRGASGIDGLLATAVGQALASQKPVVACIGDVSALHDLNSLQLASQVKTPLLIVVLNNDGGGIFRYLPIAAHADVFDRCFTTPHGRTFAPIAAAFGIRCEVPRTREETAQAASRALQHAGATLIEVRCTAESSESVRTSLAQASTAALLREFK